MANPLKKVKMQALDKYLDLLRSFVCGDISASSFEKIYLQTFKNEETVFGGQAYEILNELFGDIDEYCADPTIRDEDDIDEKELLRRVGSALERLEARKAEWEAEGSE
jgi:hypothetical protein